MSHKARRTLISLIIASGMLLVSTGEARANTVWIRQFPESDAQSIAVFDSSNIYVATTQYSLTAHPRGYLLKYDGNGNRIWARVPNLDPLMYLRGVSVDGAGNVFVVGMRGYETGALDLFVAKYSAAGAQLWQTSLYRAAEQYAADIAVAPDGSIYITGIDNVFGNRAIITMKLNAIGLLQWTRIIDTATQDQGNGIAVDFSGAYVAGSSNNTAYLVKYNSTGSVAWTAFFPSTFFDAYGVASDGINSIYVVGRAYGQLDQTLSINPFIRKYDRNGLAIWTRQFGSPAYDLATGVAATSSGRVYVSGLTEGTFPGQVSAGSTDAWVKYMTSGGAEVDTDQFGTSVYDTASDVGTDVFSNVWVSGDTAGTFPGNSHQGAGDNGFLGRFNLRP